MFFQARRREPPIDTLLARYATQPGGYTDCYTVEIDGVDLASEPDAAKVDAVRADIQMIFQDPFASLNPRWRVKDIIAEPVAARGGDTTGLAERLLEQVGLEEMVVDEVPQHTLGARRV